MASELPNRNWHAWLNTMPPGPSTLHVVGDICVESAGTVVLLVAREPQGFNPSALMLDL